MSCYKADTRLRWEWVCVVRSDQRTNQLGFPQCAGLIPTRGGVYVGGRRT